MKGRRSLMLTLAMTAGLLALAIGSRGLYARLAAEYWRRQLDTVADGQAESLLDDVAGLGESGIPVLVEALGSDRESVARAAKRTISRRLDHWQMHPGKDSLRKQAILADALAAEAGEFAATARTDAAELAVQMLRWLPDTRVADRSRVIASCEGVFRATGFRRPIRPEQIPAGQTSPATAREDPLLRRPPQDNASEPASGSVADLARLPGGRLLPDSYPSPRSRPSRIEVARTVDVPSTPPGRFTPPDDSRPVNPLRRPGQMLIAPEHSPVIPQPQERVGRVPHPGPSAVRPLDWTPEEGDSRGTRSPGWRETGTIDLMRSLRADDQRTRIGARAELVRRGFGSQHIELARRLFDPNPEIRKRLVDQLPGVPRLNATPWLMHLAHDPNTEVRLAAISLLATAGDPALLSQVGQMARQDPDARIRRVAQRIGQDH